MFEDDEEDAPKPTGLVPRDLDDMSIAALEDYIAELQAEIERVKAKLAAKQEARGTAEEIFKR